MSDKNSKTSIAGDNLSEKSDKTQNDEDEVCAPKASETPSSPISQNLSSKFRFVIKKFGQGHRGQGLLIYIYYFLYSIASLLGNSIMGGSPENGGLTLPPPLVLPSAAATINQMRLFQVTHSSQKQLTIGKK